MRKLLVLLESGLLFVGLCVGLAAWQQHRALEQPLQLTEERLLDVSSGSTPGGMLARLEQEEVLHGAFWLRLYWRFNLPGQALHSGEYRLLPGMTGADLLELWREGEVVQYSLTLVEGWSFRQVREALARQGKLEQTLAGLSDGEIMQRLGKPDEVAEGRFFPIPTATPVACATSTYCARPTSACRPSSPRNGMAAARTCLIATPTRR